MLFKTNTCDKLIKKVLEVVLSDALKKAIPQKFCEVKYRIQPSKKQMVSEALAGLKKELKEELISEIMLEVKN